MRMRGAGGERGSLGVSLQDAEERPAPPQDGKPPAPSQTSEVGVQDLASLWRGQEAGRRTPAPAPPLTESTDLKSISHIARALGREPGEAAWWGAELPATPSP